MTGKTILKTHYRITFQKICAAKYTKYLIKRFIYQSE